MQNNFWQKLNKPFSVLAPMANVTDWAFRQIIIKTGRPDVFYTEFVSADGIKAVGVEKFKGELFFEKNERPIVAQFFTAKPENMYMCAQIVQEMGFDGIDINMGCPDRSIEKQGAGAALIKNPKLARELIKETIRGAGKLPVSVKTRLGFNEIEHDWLEHLLDTGIAALAVHLRTRKEMSKVPAHWDESLKIVSIKEKIHGKSSGPLIIGNGDVVNLDDLRDKAKKYSLDGVMVGRGIFNNPWFFSDQIIEDPRQRLDLLSHHVRNYHRLWGSNRRFDYMKKFFKIYVSGWEGARELREKLMQVKNSEDVDEILKKAVV